MNNITSLQNPKIKELVRFRKKAGRLSEDIILIEDEREISRAMDAGIEFTGAFICPELTPVLSDQIKARTPEVHTVSKNVFLKAAYKNEPFGIIVMARFRTASFSDIGKDEKLVLIAESIEKPGNLGALIRTADGAGISTIVLCDKITDYRNPNMIRASTGTVFSKKIIESTTEKALRELKDLGFSVMSADPSGNTVYYNADMTKKTVLAVGSEAFGISEKMKKGSDIMVRIPMKGAADSLNVNQAATVILYEALRQNSKV